MQSQPVPTLNERARQQGGGPVVLALDLATSTGWAIRHADSVIAHGTVKFEKGSHPGNRFRMFRRFLTKTQESTSGIDRVFYEKVQFSGGRVQTQVAAQLYGAWEALLLDWCQMKGIEVEGVNVSTIKKFITGNGHAPKTEKGKRARNEEAAKKNQKPYEGPTVETTIHDKGFYPNDDNAADALALMLFALDQLDITEWLPGPTEKRIAAGKSF